MPCSFSCTSGGNDTMYASMVANVSLMAVAPSAGRDRGNGAENPGMCREPDIPGQGS
jgi:hypothetical protein